MNDNDLQRIPEDGRVMAPKNGLDYLGIFGCYKRVSGSGRPGAKQVEKCLHKATKKCCRS